MTIYNVADMPRPDRCYLCQERGDVRPYGKPEWEVYRGPGPGDTTGETYRGVCGDCADDIIAGADAEGAESFLIGYVP
jgi:hypothetical protein